jgi:hypothetical protein
MWFMVATFRNVKARSRGSKAGLVTMPPWQSSDETGEDNDRESDQDSRSPPSANRSGDLGGGHADPVPFLQDLVGGGRKAVDADQEVVGLTVRQLLGEELGDGGALGHFDVAGESGTFVVDEENFHGVAPEKRVNAAVDNAADEQ